MLNQKRIKPSMFQMVTIDQLVPKDYFYRKVEAVLDLSFVRDTVKDLYCPDNGRPAIDPERAVRMMLIGYFENFSDNRLCREIEMHAGYRWFCKLDFHDPVPDRTSLIKIRARWGVETFDQLFQKVVAQCVEAGLVKGDVVAMDGTQVRARASVKSLEQIAPVISIEEYLSRFEEPKAQAKEPPKPPSDSGNKNFRGEKFSNETHRSRTDPDARHYRKAAGQEAYPRYLVHDALDVKSGVILDTEATRATGYAEREAALQFMKNLDGRLFVMDKGYRGADFLAEALAFGARPFVPLDDPTPVAIPTWKRRTFKLPQLRKRRRAIREALALNYVKALNGKKLYSRMYVLRAKVEHKFAEAKEHHGLRRARGYGLPSMRIQARMTAMVQNIKRLVSFRRKSRPHMGRVIAQANASDSAFKVLGQPFMRLCFGFRFFRLVYCP